MKATSKIIVWAMLAALSLFPAISQATQFDDEDTPSHRNYKLMQLHRFPGCYQAAREQESYTQHDLLVLKIDRFGRATINPEDERPGWINHDVRLGELSLADAKNRWGEPHGENTFDLIAPTNIEKDVYHVDFKFENDRVCAYRVRGIGITNSEWMPVKPAQSNSGQTNGRTRASR